MMDLIKSTDGKYEEYEELLMERDRISKDAQSIWRSYIRIFGQLITEVCEEKIECMKCKKTISHYQAAMNHGGVVDPEAMKQSIDQEMAAYYANLNRMQDDNKRCREDENSTPYEVEEAETLYRRMAKLLHPDINPETGRRKELMELWQRILTAYDRSDVKELSELEVLTRRALKDLGAGEIRIEVPDIEERIESLKTEIYEITHTEPYTHRDTLGDQTAVDRKTKGLKKELESYRKYRSELEAVIQDMVQNGGIRLQRQMQ